MSSFPSLVIHRDRFEARGTFAEAQAAFLDPDPEEVRRLETLLRATHAGIVAHFYMDPELQGVLTAADHPHIAISDSLAMADSAIGMVRAGAKVILVLGVDFMSENVRAMLDAAGHADVPVYRVADKPIGCSLAESAESDAYMAYLSQAAASGPALHVVYINTSLATKARAHALVPTITCTSSNVVSTVLQAYAQVPGLSVFFGPDSYMGQNLQDLFESLAELGDEAVRSVHPAHTAQTLRAALERFRFFRQGTCVVHHMFGAAVAERVQAQYSHAHVTAHLEVPGEMFRIALDAQRQGRGVVGSTSDILKYIGSRVDRELSAGTSERVSFVLGTESGMITSIVDDVRRRLRAAPQSELAVEIVFPVAAEAITATLGHELAVVPGVAAGEGCSTEGGCASCPYMKMNSLDATVALLESLDQSAAALRSFLPRKYSEQIRGKSVAALGGEPILHMRALQQSGRLSDALVKDIEGRALSLPA
ncbi:MAG: quinolinate synthase NadA [Polyangiaceae bacterium]